MIEETQWCPPGSLKLYKGRHLRLGGNQIGEVDAIVELDGNCTLGSCKSCVYTAAYDVGLYNTACNTAVYILPKPSRTGKLSSRSSGATPRATTKISRQ